MRLHVSVYLAGVLFLLSAPGAVAEGDAGAGSAGSGNRGRARATFKALVPYADACWAATWGERAAAEGGGGGEVLISDSDSAVILLPTHRSFVACHPDAAMDMRFALTHAAIHFAQNNNVPGKIYMYIQRAR